MNYEFRMRELDIGRCDYVVCLKCISDYRVAQRNECECRAKNQEAGTLREFKERIGETA